jgi:hypothetical protein
MNGTSREILVELTIGKIQARQHHRHAGMRVDVRALRFWTAFCP